MKDDRQKLGWPHPRIGGSRDHQHGRRLSMDMDPGLDRRRFRADRAASLWSVNRTDQHFLQKSITGYFKGCQFLHGGVLLFIVGTLMGGHLDHMSIAGVELISTRQMVSACGVSHSGRSLLAHNEASKVGDFRFGQSTLQRGVIGVGSLEKPPGI